MKKMIITTAALALTAMAVSAADVFSSNIVGYTKLSIGANGIDMFGSTFALVGGTTSVPIASLFDDNTVFTSGPTVATADVIQVWTGAGYKSYFYGNELEDTDDGLGWTLNGETETTDVIPAGGSFWFRRRGAALTNTMLVSGEVVTNSTQVAVYANTVTMVGNPFGAAVPISTITAPDLTSGPTVATADVIQVWTGAGYTSYFYGNELEDTDDGLGWTLNGETETSATIAIGDGFWFRRRGSATTITLPVPY